MQGAFEKHPDSVECLIVESDCRAEAISSETSAGLSSTSAIFDSVKKKSGHDAIPHHIPTTGGAFRGEKRFRQLAVKGKRSFVIVDRVVIAKYSCTQEI